MKKNTLKLAVAAMGFAMSGMAAAATTEGCPVTDTTCTGTIEVIARILGACQHLATNDIDFGTHVAADKNVTIPTNIEVTCNAGQAYSVELDYGLHKDNTGFIRQLLSDDGSTELIDYDVFQPNADGTVDAANTKAWGQASENTEFLGTGTGTIQTLTANSVMRLSTAATPGIYTDEILVTLTFPPAP